MLRRTAVTVALPLLLYTAPAVAEPQAPGGVVPAEQVAQNDPTGNSAGVDIWGLPYVWSGYTCVSCCPRGWRHQTITSTYGFNVGPEYYAAGPDYYSAWTAVPQSSRTIVPGVRASSPRYVNRGDEIVRSQTGPAIAPRQSTMSQDDRPLPGRADSAGVARRPTYAWDNPVYQPPSSTRGSERAVPRAELHPQVAPGRIEAPSYQRPGGAMRPPAAEYPRANLAQPPARSAERQAAPGGLERAAPRSSGAAPVPAPHVETRAGAMAVRRPQ